jgi:hypothetical protein
MNLLKGSGSSLGQTLGRQGTRRPDNRVSRASSDRQSKDLMQKIEKIEGEAIYWGILLTRALGME